MTIYNLSDDGDIIISPEDLAALLNQAQADGIRAAINNSNANIFGGHVWCLETDLMAYANNLESGNGFD